MIMVFIIDTLKHDISKIEMKFINIWFWKYFLLLKFSLGLGLHPRLKMQGDDFSKGEHRLSEKRKKLKYIIWKAEWLKLNNTLLW